MPRCTRAGCNQDYEKGGTGPCRYHSGKAVFHEGLKSWSCCNDTNKPVLDFESFLAIPGCASEDSHTDSKPTPAPVFSKNSLNKSESDKAISLHRKKDEGGTEIYNSGPSVERLESSSVLPVTKPIATSPTPLLEDEDDHAVMVEVGTPCKRKGCNKTFVSHEESRAGDGEAAVCYYHPAPPLFREGSKGYLCCKRRVLEFDEFMKIPGCKKGRHLFVIKGAAKVDATVACRIDHYQTPKEVIVSIFAKQADKDRSVITFTQSKLTLDISLPNAKRFARTLDLYGAINAESSSYQILASKIEVKLVKLDGKCWNALEMSNSSSQGLNLTFGVGGRTGTVGGKDLVLDSFNQKVA